MSDVTTTYEEFRPGQVWLDTSGKRIQAHGGSILTLSDGTFLWYGENKERTVPGADVWHWGMRAYRSRDLYNWEDLGTFIPPQPEDPSSPLHPAQMADRPHILYSSATGTYVCWIKIMSQEAGIQEMTILVADNVLGPYEIARTGFRPLGMNAGDFDLVLDPDTGRAVVVFEKVHTELIVADLTDDLTDVTGRWSSHFPHPSPPWVREAPAFFRRNGRSYLITSGTSGYFPNPSEAAVADDIHGPWTVLGDVHPSDPSRTSFGSQISSVFQNPTRSDLYIGLGDRWLPGLDPSAPSVFDRMAELASAGDLDGALALSGGTVGGVPVEQTTWQADYVWLPIRFEGERPIIEWQDSWRVEDFKPSR
jgi:hypothetical protein